MLDSLMVFIHIKIQATSHYRTYKRRVKIYTRTLCILPIIPHSRFDIQLLWVHSSIPENVWLLHDTQDGHLGA